MGLLQEKKIDIFALSMRITPNRMNAAVRFEKVCKLSAHYVLPSSNNRQTDALFSSKGPDARNSNKHHTTIVHTLPTLFNNGEDLLKTSVLLGPADVDSKLIEAHGAFAIERENFLSGSRKEINNDEKSVFR
ncbi:hypothetical protein L596_015625 [Steinernema carpocapsae]|uniref:Uncharacterized protein n=1 Tax=Steinernema carpocapsae TaxID=34508 RepID=A0A4U5NGS8_STECR|nr:hypothetical protein L596_015625 [Steinernema carpocapsae]